MPNVPPHPRNQGRRASQPTPTAKSNDDDFGCLLVVIAVLWYFGFISFHWRDKEQPAERLEEVREQLAQADSQLAKLTSVVQAIKADSSALASRRSSLEQQVAQLERARDEIASSLRAASNMVTAPAKSRWRAFWDELYTSVIGNLISALILAGLSWFGAKLLWRFFKKRKTPTSPAT